MLTVTQKDEITGIVEQNLDNAEAIWNAVGGQIVSYAAMDEGLMRKSAETLPSKIPGHEMVTDIDPTVDEFIALVADMRESSKHLLCAISRDRADVSQLQRVYYETSALLPALAKTIMYKGGKVTEYLGDGVLGLFQVGPENLEDQIQDAYRAAENCIADTRLIVNKVLNSRYRLPCLDIGVGLAISKAIVTLVGLDGDKHPKVVGECVYRATKLADGKNEVHVDERLRVQWPTTKGGNLSFSKYKNDVVDGYLVKRV